MRTIYHESDIIALIELVLGRPMNEAERKRYAEHRAKVDDPKYGYNIMRNLGMLAYWLVDVQGYSLSRFAGGIGLTMNNGGGCWGYLDDKFVAQLVRHKLLDPTGWPTITFKGQALLGQVSAKRRLGRKFFRSTNSQPKEQHNEKNH